MAFAETLSGRVLTDDDDEMPIPGVEVRLYNPEVGSSQPRYTNGAGKLCFDNVPYSETEYDIEFFWRGELIFPDYLQIFGDTDYGDAFL